jgi:hypothetical protein
VADAGAVLVTGPANAKTELVEYIHVHDPKLTQVIAGVETVDHPSDAQLVAYARKISHGDGPDAAVHVSFGVGMSIVRLTYLKMATASGSRGWLADICPADQTG